VLQQERQWKISMLGELGAVALAVAVVGLPRYGAPPVGYHVSARGDGCQCHPPSS
jgi:hypothetical protein